MFTPHPHPILPQIMAITNNTYCYGKNNVAESGATNMEDLSWLAYKEEDGHPLDGFIYIVVFHQACEVKIYDYKFIQGGDHLTPYRQTMMDSMSPMT